MAPAPIVVPVSPRSAANHMAETFEAAYRSFSPEIRGYLLRATRDAGAADDLTQETFLRLCRELQAGQAILNVRAWLYRVATNLVASRGRRLEVARRWLEGADVERTVPEDTAPEWSVLRRDRHGQLEQALAEMPRDARVALLMAAVGYSGREIAQALDRSEVATRTLLFRARLRLRNRLEDEAAPREAVAPALQPVATRVGEPTARTAPLLASIRRRPVDARTGPAMPDGPRLAPVAALRSGRH